MVQHWTASDLQLALAADRGPELGARLQAAFRDAVRRGTLRPGDALPSSRALAAHLGTARGTIVGVYEQLVAEGYFIAHGGSRTRISPHVEPVRPPRTTPAATTWRFDLRPGVPDLRRFAASDWAWAYAQAARSLGSASLDYGDGRGHFPAREVLATHLRRVRAAEVDTEGVIFASGFAQCAALVFDALVAQGVRRIAVEDPGDRSVDRAVARSGGTVLPVPVDDDGLRVDLLATTDAQAVVVTPAHQTPTGAVLSPARRGDLLAWAARTGGWIVEDDYDSEFRYDRQPVGCLQGLAPDRVVLVGSASKTHAPAVRLGWMAVPSPLADDIAQRRLDADRGGSALGQLAFARLIESGRHDRHVRTMRGVYATRRKTLVDALRACRAPMRLTGISAGFHGVLALPDDVDVDEIVRDAAAHSIRLRGLGAYAAAPTGRGSALALGFGNIDDEALVEALRILDRLIVSRLGGRSMP